MTGGTGDLVFDPTGDYDREPGTSDPAASDDSDPAASDDSDPAASDDRDDAGAFAPPAHAHDPAAFDPGELGPPGGPDPGSEPPAHADTWQKLGGDAGDDEGASRQGSARRRGRSRSGRQQGRPRSGRRLAPRPEGTRRFLVLGGGSGGTDVAALDLDSRVLVRLHGGLPVLPDGTVEPFDVVDGTVSRHEELDDPARPEALLIAGQLERAGVARGRRARRALRGIVAPPEPHLLGFPGSSWPYWEFHGGRPSVAVVTPSRGPMLFLRSEDGTAWARFGWYRTDNWLPVHDARAVRALVAAGQRRLVGKALAAGLGFRPAYLVVAVGRPRNGYCTKELLAVLPRP